MPAGADSQGAPARSPRAMNEHELAATADAMVWAEQFTLRIQAGCDPTDVGWTVGWFANAMAAAEADIRRRTAVPPRSLTTGEHDETTTWSVSIPGAIFWLLVALAAGDLVLKVIRAATQ